MPLPTAGTAHCGNTTGVPVVVVALDGLVLEQGVQELAGKAIDTLTGCEKREVVIRKAPYEFGLAYKAANRLWLNTGRFS